MDNAEQRLIVIYDGEGGWNLANEDGSPGSKLERPYLKAGADRVRVATADKTEKTGQEFTDRLLGNGLGKVGFVDSEGFSYSGRKGLTGRFGVSELTIDIYPPKNVRPRTVELGDIAYGPRDPILQLEPGDHDPVAIAPLDSAFTETDIFKLQDALC